MSQMPGSGIGYQYNQTGVANDPLLTTPGPSGSGLGYTGYRGYQGQMPNQQSGLPTVSDPDKAYEAITRGEYFDFVNNYGGFEDELIEKARTDTSLIDAAREDVKIASGLTKGIALRSSTYACPATAARRYVTKSKYARWYTGRKRCTH